MSRTRDPVAPDLAALCGRIGLTSSPVVADNGLRVVTWGLPEGLSWQDGVLVLSAKARRHEQDLNHSDVRRLLIADGGAGFAQLLPTTAVASMEGEGRLVAATDYLGFRHLYYAQGKGWAAVSTSSKILALALGADLDRTAVAVQSLLGWQLGLRSIFEGVRKLPAGHAVSLHDGRVEMMQYSRRATDSGVEVGQAVRLAADMLRTFVTTYVEQHPDVGLQLTGGQDSRLLLSAIPLSLRKGLRAVTLGAAGDPDVDIASSLAQRYGMPHEILSTTGLEKLEPSEAHHLCLAAARRLDFTADPVAHAALTFAESQAIEGPRLSGLGGEVARGFYYLGPSTDAGATPRRARRLASWRMFVNESVTAEAVEPTFRSWARGVATEEVVEALTGPGLPWMAATDHLYLAHRMQRWAGVTETAVSWEREIVNPMLDDRFISLAEAISPRDKRNALFLSRLQLELDAELGSIPLDGRPAPSAYATRTLGNSARMVRSTAQKAGRKVLQRAQRASRPPAGGQVLAEKVVSHWRSMPDVLEAAHAVGVFSPEWLDGVIEGRVTPGSSEVALLTNLCAARQYQDNSDI